MESKGKRDVEGERRGRQEVAGKGENTSERNEAGRRARLRRATFDDLEAIIDINDNVYGGADYMRALFYVLMQSKQHAIYVIEEDGKLVSLANLSFHSDDDALVSVMSGRVRSTHEGRGFGLAPTGKRFAQILKEHPTLKSYVMDTFLTSERSAKMNGVKLNYHWNVFIYRLSDRQWLSRVARTRQMASDSNRPFSLSYSIASEWLERSDQLSRFLSKYVTDLFPCGTSWNPTPLNRSGLRHMLSSNKVYVTMDTSSTIDNSLPDHKMSSAGLGPKARTSDRGREGDLVGLSYSTACPCKNGIRMDIFFYGDNEQVFLSHIYSHLLHYVNVTSDDVRLVIAVHFPLVIDAENVAELLRDGLGDRARDVGATQAVQYMGDFPQAKL